MAGLATTLATTLTATLTAPRPQTFAAILAPILAPTLNHAYAVLGAVRPTQRPRRWGVGPGQGSRSPLVLLTLAVALGGCQGLDPSSPSSGDSAADPLTFGILSTESTETQKPLWEPFLAAMGDSLGQPVEAFYAEQYSDLIEGLRSGQVEIAWMGGKAYIEAAQTAGAEAFALTVAADGAMGYYAHLIARRDQPWLEAAIEQGGDRYVLDHAADLTFAFNDPESTSGFLVPNYYIFARNGVQASTIFKELRFEGDHEATALAVAGGSVDVATNNSEALARLAQAHPEASEQLAIIWTSQLIPGDPIAYDRTIDPELKTRIQDFFYTYAEASILNPLDWSRFEPADDTVWNPIRALDLSQSMEEVRNNDKIGEAEKQTILNQLDQQLKALEALPDSTSSPPGSPQDSPQDSPQNPPQDSP